MTQELEKTWAGKVFNSAELKAYAQFEQDLKNRLTEKEKVCYEEEWASLVKVVNASLDKDPASDLGFSLGKRCMDWVNSLYGKEYIALRNAIWEKGFKTSQIDVDNNLSPQSFAWLDSAIETYYKRRVAEIFQKVEKNPDQSTLSEWQDLLTDMYGDQNDKKDEMIDMILNAETTSQAIKNWLIKVRK